MHRQPKISGSASRTRASDLPGMCWATFWPMPPDCNSTQAVSSSQRFRSCRGRANSLQANAGCVALTQQDHQAIGKRLGRR